MTAKPKTAGPTDSAPNKTEWKKEIHTPDAEYNANVPIDAIERDPANRVPAPEAVADRADSIRAVGLLQPIVLRSLTGGRYQLMAGETRWLAFKSLRRLTIPARIYKNQSEIDAAMKALVENAQRSDLTPIERAKRFKQLSDLKVSQKEIGRLAGGLSQPVVANALRLLELPEAVQAMIMTGALSEAHGVCLAKWAKWARACTRMAEMARDHEYSAKQIAQDGLPFANELVGRGLLEKIQIKARYMSDGGVYKLPRHLGSHRDFILGEFHAYYFVPEDPKDNVWAPVKAEQDAERAKVAAAESAKASKQVSSGKLSAEQVERRKTIEKNKQQRAENEQSLKLALDKLRRTHTPSALLIAILVEGAIAGGYGAKRILEAAELVGVKLPKGLVSDQGGYGMREVKAMREMDVMELTRVALAVLLVKEIDNANKNAWGLPNNVEFVMNSVVPPANLGIGDEVTWADGKKQGVIISVADYEKCTGIKWPKAWTGNSTPVRLTRQPDQFGLPFNSIQTDGLCLVKSAAPAELVKESAIVGSMKDRAVEIVRAGGGERDIEKKLHVGPALARTFYKLAGLLVKQSPPSERKT